MGKYGGKKVNPGDLDDDLIIANDKPDAERIKQTGEKITLNDKQYRYLESKLSTNARELPLKEKIKLAVMALVVIIVIIAVYIATREVFFLGVIIVVIVLFFIIVYVEKRNTKHDIQLLNALKEGKFEVYSFAIVQKLWYMDSPHSHWDSDTRAVPYFFLECKDIIFQPDEVEYKRIKDNVWVVLFSIDDSEIRLGFYNAIA